MNFFKFLLREIKKKLENDNIQDISEINGLTHYSDYIGKKATVRGSITKISRYGFIIQDKSDYNKGSNAIFIARKNEIIPVKKVFSQQGKFIVNDKEHILHIGDSVLVSGTVSFTQYNNGVRSNKINYLEKIVVISTDNREVQKVNIGQKFDFFPNPLRIDNDLITDFNRKESALDFWTSLNQQLVCIHDVTIVYKDLSNRFNYYAIRINLKENSTLLSEYGNAIYNEYSKNSDTILLSSRFLKEISFIPGDKVEKLYGHVSYKYGRFYINPRNDLDIIGIKMSKYHKELQNALLEKRLPKYHKQEYLKQCDKELFGVGTLNLYNFKREPALNLVRTAEYTVSRLCSPHIFLLQEMLDDSGSKNDGVTEADLNIGFLKDTFTYAINEINKTNTAVTTGIDNVIKLDNIEREYEVINVDPENNTQGGVPGGNIRCITMYDKLLFELIDFGSIKINQSKFTSGTRDPLWCRLKNKKTGTIYLVINVHCKSKSGNDNPWSLARPIINKTKQQRTSNILDIINWIKENKKDDEYLIMGGDFNDFQFSDPMKQLDDQTNNSFLKNLTFYEKENRRYTKNFRGIYSCLDHICIDKTLYNTLIDNDQLFYKIWDTEVLQWWVTSVGEPQLLDHNFCYLSIPKNL